MNSFLSNCFLLPMGLGSTAYMYLSAYNGTIFAPFTDNKTYDEEITVLLLISFFYFVIDFILMIYRYIPKYKVYFVHHMIGLFSIPIVYFCHYDMIKYLLSYLMFELSTPFLNISMANHRKGIFDNYTKAIDILFFVTYTFVRIIYGSFLMCKTTPIIYSMEFPFKYLAILPVLLQILMYYWYNKIVSMLFQKLI